MRFIILVNPNAGRGKARLVLREALEVIRRGGTGERDQLPGDQRQLQCERDGDGSELSVV